MALLKSELNDKREEFLLISTKFQQIEHLRMSDSKVIKDQHEKTLELNSLKKENDENNARMEELENEKREIKNSYEVLIVGMNDEIDRLKIELAKKNDNKIVNNSMVDNDDLTILLVENENLKKKIKILENETAKQNANEKMIKKGQEKDVEIGSLKQKIELLEKKVVK